MAGINDRITPVTGVPDRIEWAIELLDIDADDHIVEIGGGNGVAAQLVLQRLGPRGRLIFIDRSSVGVARATDRNGDDPRFVAIEGEVAGVQLQAGSTDKIFAVNVNVFWAGDAGDELEVVKRALRPEGMLLLVYEAPSRDRLDEIGGQGVLTLTRAGFTAELRVTEDQALLAVVAEPTSAASRRRARGARPGWTGDASWPGPSPRSGGCARE